jgi:plasmid replication initiation protein
MLIGGDVEEEHDLVGKILRIYAWASGYKFQEKITSSKFARLATLPNMTKENFIKYDYNLLF